MRPRKFSLLVPLILLIACSCICFVLAAGQTRSSKGRPSPANPKFDQLSVQQTAEKVAENYWKARTVKCGASTLWTVLRSKVLTPPNGDMTTFEGKGPPVITVDGQYFSRQTNPDETMPRENETQPPDWSGKARISFTRGGAVGCISCKLEGLKRDFGYTIQVRRVNGIWETQENDFPNEAVMKDPVFEDVAAGRGALLSQCLSRLGNANERNEAGETLLMTAAKFGRGDAVLMLLEYGADPNLKHRDGTASYIARLQNHEELITVFDQIGAVCDGPVKTICEKRKQEVSGFATLVADPLLIAPRDSPYQSTREDGLNKRVRILSKPEPQYTDEARAHQVVGNVILSILFLPSGQVTNIRVLSGLPYGLTERAIEAARELKFTPAMRDGKPVEMEMRMEYVFQLY